jgi:hypothetical protein
MKKLLILLALPILVSCAATATKSGTNEQDFYKDLQKCRAKRQDSEIDTLLVNGEWMTPSGVVCMKAKGWNVQKN